MFLEVVENGISNTDKLLICLAILLLLTIVWTILIGIMFKLKERNLTVSKTNRFLLDEDDEDEVVVVEATKTTKKKPAKKAKTTKTKKTSASRTTKRVVRAKSKQETYVKVKFYRTNKSLIYVAPENVILRKGDKIKVRTDEGDIKSATVTQGNYTRDRYKTYEYQTLDLVA